MVDMPKPMMPDFKGTPVIFLKEVKTELKKVQWPTKDEVIKLTLIVIVISIAVGVYIGAMDFIFVKANNFLFVAK